MPAATPSAEETSRIGAARSPRALDTPPENASGGPAGTPPVIRGKSAGPRRFTDEKRLTWSFVAGLGLLLGMGVIFAVQVFHFLFYDGRVTHSNQVIREIERTLFEVQAAESAQRGFTASGQETYLPPYLAAVETLPAHLAGLRRQTGDNPLQQRNVAELATAIDGKLAFMRQRFDERRALGAAVMEVRYLNGRGRRPMEAIVAIANRMIEVENTLLRQRGEARAAGLHVSMALLLGTGVVGATLLLASFLFIRRELRHSRALGGELSQVNLGLGWEVTERRRAQQRLSVQHAVAHIAAENVTMEEAAPCFLRTVCEHLDWEVGELWTADPATDRLRPTGHWFSESVLPGQTALNAAFVEASRGWEFADGEGLPGRVRAAGGARWERDLEHSSCFRRKAQARAAGLHRALAFPLRTAGHGAVNRVMLFLSCHQGAPDPELIATMDTVAGQIAQFAERCSVEVDLRASQARFTAFIENAPALAYIKDPAGRMLYGNETLLRTFHLRADEWLGKTDADLWPEATPAIRENDLAVLAGEVPVELNESFPLPDGRLSHWLSYKFPLPDQATGRKLLAGISIDVTAREEAADFRRARDEAERASRAKSEFLSRVSHELRTPLNAILGFGQLLQANVHDERDVESLEYMLKASRHLLGLVDEVLDISRAESGELQLVPGNVALGEIVHECMGLTARLALDGGVTCELEGIEDHVALWCDEKRLRQIVLNLLSNAIKYNRPEGRVRVWHERRAGGRLRLHVSDTGPGLTPEETRRLFMPFERLEQKRGKVEGIGLGLVVSRRMAEAMGGSMGVESEVGEGSTFWLELPLGSGQAAQAADLELEIDADFLAGLTR